MDLNNLSRMNQTFKITVTKTVSKAFSKSHTSSSIYSSLLPKLPNSDTFTRSSNSIGKGVKSTNKTLMTCIM